MSRHKIDFIVGLFVIVAVVGVVFIALRAANIAGIAIPDGYNVQVHFDNVGSLVDQSPVKSSGVRVGRVTNISYSADEHVAVVDMTIDRRFQFPADSLFAIVSTNLLGGQFITINVGGEETMLADGDVIQGESAIILEELISKFLFDEAGE